MKTVRILVGAALAISSALLPSCGTTTSLTDSGGKEIESSQRTFRGVAVPDFRSNVKSSEVGAAPAKSYFAERVAENLRAGKMFKSVSRGRSSGADTLLIDGEITRYVEGNELAKLMVGLGAGSSYLDATVIFRDGSGRELGRMTVDRNSWVLGGIVATMQTPQTFMDEAAKKIAAEATKFAKP